MEQANAGIFEWFDVDLQPVPAGSSKSPKRWGSVHRGIVVYLARAASGSTGVWRAGIHQKELKSSVVVLSPAFFPGREK
ncbi:MAG: hypothetical protein M3Q07_11175, partial [Pseudobdellovibrionaceae bacterium]|nr:hypothetical protein [Pseudobdellovibrionaceae bacterium]